MRYTSSFKSCQPSVYHTKVGEFRQVPIPTAQQVNLPACSPHCPFNAEGQAGKLWIPILKSLVWPDSESNPSLQLKRQTLYTTRPSELLLLTFLILLLVRSSTIFIISFEKNSSHAFLAVSAWVAIPATPGIFGSSSDFGCRPVLHCWMFDQVISWFFSFFVFTFCKTAV